jgi:hypothetical protein
MLHFLFGNMESKHNNECTYTRVDIVTYKRAQVLDLRGRLHHEAICAAGCTVAVAMLLLMLTVDVVCCLISMYFDLLKSCQLACICYLFQCIYCTLFTFVS